MDLSNSLNCPLDTPPNEHTKFCFPRIILEVWYYKFPCAWKFLTTINRMFWCVQSKLCFASFLSPAFTAGYLYPFVSLRMLILSSFYQFEQPSVDYYYQFILLLKTWRHHLIVSIQIFFYPIFQHCHQSSMQFMKSIFHFPYPILVAYSLTRWVSCIFSYKMSE